VDARLGRHVIPLELSMVGQNLVQAQHIEAGFPDSAQEQIVRSSYAKISYSG
jgi:hypothetical protein